MEEPKPTEGPLTICPPLKYKPGPGTRAEDFVTPPVSRFSVPKPEPVFLGENPLSGL
jgi:hypothetical protein